ncbi:MAG: hypothetical protein WC069_07025 [Candidatus Shapirobacteria bacterium]
MKQLFILLILTAFGLQNCNVVTSGAWIDENIDQSLKNEIKTLDEKVIEAITSSNSSLVKSMMPDKVLEKSGQNIDQSIEQMGKATRGTDFHILNQFHVKNSTTGIGNTVMSGVSGQNDYIIHYQALNIEMFISLLITTNGLDDFLLTNIYGKYPDGWKLNILQFGQYKINGQTATELYSKAKKEYDKGYLVDAANNMILSSKVANPANRFWQYQKEEEMNQFYETLMAEIKTKYIFPLVVENIDTKPQVLNIYPFGMQEGYFPMVEYITNIELEDTVKTKVENDLIHKSIGEIFTGLDKEKKFVFYMAYSEIPNGKTPVPAYGFVKEIK